MKLIYDRLQNLVKNGILKISISYNESHEIQGYGQGNELIEYYLDEHNKVLFQSIVRTAKDMDTDYECFLFGTSTPVTDKILVKYNS